MKYEVNNGLMCVAVSFSQAIALFSIQGALLGSYGAALMQNQISLIDILYQIPINPIEMPRNLPIQTYSSPFTSNQTLHGSQQSKMFNSLMRSKTNLLNSSFNSSANLQKRNMLRKRSTMMMPDQISTNDIIKVQSGNKSEQNTIQNQSTIITEVKSYK
ncbi:MAG: hypothetical protein EZS28_049968, partial [Streblomastix strix]